jgi:hypothetical protein
MVFSVLFEHGVRSLDITRLLTLAIPLSILIEWNAGWECQRKVELAVRIANVFVVRASVKDEIRHPRILQSAILIFNGGPDNVISSLKSQGHRRRSSCIIDT